MKLYPSLVAAALLATVVHAGSNNPKAHSMNDADRHAYNAGRTLSIGLMIYEAYTPLDLQGPLQIMSSFSFVQPMTLAIIGERVGPVSSRTPNSTSAIVSSMYATHDPTTAPPLDLLLVPGGITAGTLWIEQFLQERYDSTDYITSVCTGSVILARSGILDNKRATSNKRAWPNVILHGENVTWVPNARWVKDDSEANGKVWTSSGVAAGMDMAYALFGWMYGTEKLNATMNNIEYSPHTDEHWDPYAVVHKVPGANTTRPLLDLVGPVGYY